MSKTHKTDKVCIRKKDMDEIIRLSMLAFDEVDGGMVDLAFEDLDRLTDLLLDVECKAKKECKGV